MKEMKLVFKVPDTDGTHRKVMMFLNKMIRSHNDLNQRVINDMYSLPFFRLIRYLELNRVLEMSNDIINYYATIGSNYEMMTDLNDLTLTDFVKHQYVELARTFEEKNKAYEATKRIRFSKRRKLKIELDTLWSTLDLIKTLAEKPALLERFVGGANDKL